MSSSIDVKRSSALHRQETSALRQKQQRELDQMRLGHQARMAATESQQKQQLADLRARHEINLLNQANQQEQVLEKMRQSLLETQKSAEKQKQEIASNLAESLERKKAQQSQKLERESSARQLALEEMSHKAEIELARLERQRQTQESELKRSSREQMEALRTQASKELSMNNETYQVKQAAAEDKYQKALRESQKTQSEVLANEERKFHQALRERSLANQTEISRLQNDGALQREQAQKSFETQYAQLLQQHEAELARLSANKERMIQELKNEVIQAHKLDASRSNDPFYSHTTLEPKIKEGDNAYLVSLRVSEEDAAKVALNGHQRKLALSLNRSYENTRSEDNSSETVKKVETLTRQFSVDKIVDVNKIQKSYRDGVLTFTVPWA